MKTPLWIALTLVVVLGAGSGLAVLKSGVQDRSSHLVRAGFRHSTSRKGWNVGLRKPAQPETERRYSLAWYAY